MKVEGETIKIRTKAKAAASKEEKIKHMDKGMINPKSNVITIKNYGHYANECRKKHSDMGNRPSANLTKKNISQENFFLAFNMVEEKNEDIWFLD